MNKVELAVWADRPGFEKLLKVLGADKDMTRLVGGAVRDTLLGLPCADIDMATRMPPEDTLRTLEAAGIKAVPTGLAHGTVTAVVGQLPYEITTLRRDVEHDGRHAQVAFTSDWQEDAARRDFTINALYANPITGEVFDYYNGLQDLADKRVRFIREPLVRIAEDHLRILRFFRFSARYAQELDPEGLAACAARANDLMALSRERIRDEVLKILGLKNPLQTVRAMIENGIFAPVLPEITAAALPRLESLIQQELAAGASPHGLRRLAALLPTNPDMASDIGTRLKLSNADRQRLSKAAQALEIPQDPRILAYTYGADTALDLMLLANDPRTTHWVGQLKAYQRPRLPVSGKDLIEMGIAPGPEVSRKLAMVEAQWMAAGFPAGRDKSFAIARDVLGMR